VDDNIFDYRYYLAVVLVYRMYKDFGRRNMGIICEMYSNPFNDVGLGIVLGILACLLIFAIMCLVYKYTNL